MQYVFVDFWIFLIGLKDFRVTQNDPQKHNKFHFLQRSFFVQQIFWEINAASR